MKQTLTQGLKAEPGNWLFAAVLALPVLIIESAWPLIKLAIVALILWLGFCLITGRPVAFARVVCPEARTISDDSGPEDARPAVPHACHKE